MPCRQDRCLPCFAHLSASCPRCSSSHLTAGRREPSLSGPAHPLALAGPRRPGGSVLSRRIRWSSLRGARPRDPLGQPQRHPRRDPAGHVPRTPAQTLIDSGCRRRQQGVKVWARGHLATRGGLHQRRAPNCRCLAPTLALLLPLLFWHGSNLKCRGQRTGVSTQAAPAVSTATRTARVSTSRNSSR